MRDVPPYIEAPLGIPQVELEYFPGWGDIQVYEEDNPTIATLYGTDGDVLLEIRERPQVPFGFQKG